MTDWLSMSCRTAGLLLALAAAAHGQALLFEDDYDPTAGDAIRGEAVVENAALRCTGRTGYMIYDHHSPLRFQPGSSGTIEFWVTGVGPDPDPVKNELFMTCDTTGVGDCARDNGATYLTSSNWFLMRQRDDGRLKFAGSFSGAGVEINTPGSIGWSASDTYHFRVTWSDGQVRVYRRTLPSTSLIQLGFDGVGSVIPGDFNPQALQHQVGATVRAFRTADSGAQAGTRYLQFRVFDDDIGTMPTGDPPAFPSELYWTKIGTYTVPGGSLNWCFNPAEYNGHLFVPMGDYGTCVVKKWDGSSWSDDFLDDDWGDGEDFENLAYLQEFDSKLYMITEVDSTGDMGIMVRDAAGDWSISHQYGYTPDPLKEMGAFGAAICNGKLYTAVNPYPAGTLTVYEHDGANWTPIKYYHTGEQLRAWSLGSDGTNVYVGIGRWARNNAATLGIERYDGITWTSELSGLAMHSMAYYKGSMYAGGNGPIYRRSSDGTWSVVFDTGQTFVVSMAIVDLGDFQVLYAGTENNPRLYSTLDGADWELERDFGSGTGPCYVGQYLSSPAAAVCYPEQAGRPVETWISELAGAQAPDIIPVDRDTAFVGREYVKQLALAHGTPPLSWSVLEGPTGVQVDGDGQVTGWTPELSDAGSSFLLRIEVTNASGSDDEDWLIDVFSPADFDRDNDADLSDFGHLQACLSGNGQPYADGCQDADLQGDGDVDQDDFGLFLPCMGGAENPPGC